MQLWNLPYIRLVSRLLLHWRVSQSVGFSTHTDPYRPEPLTDQVWPGPNTALFLTRNTKSKVGSQSKVSARYGMQTEHELSIQSCLTTHACCCLDCRLNCPSRRRISDSSAGGLPPYTRWWHASHLNEYISKLLLVPNKNCLTWSIVGEPWYSLKFGHCWPDENWSRSLGFGSLYHEVWWK